MDSPSHRFGCGRWHCDDFLANTGIVPPLRAFLEFTRAPAVEQRGAKPKLFATLCRDVSAGAYQGRWVNGSPLMRAYVLPKGSRVRVVMASRFGDVGITDDLTAENGYVARLFIPELHDFSGEA